jgi:hypothetical protein
LWQNGSVLFDAARDVARTDPASAIRMVLLREIVEKNAAARRRSACVAFALVLGSGAPLHAAERSNSIDANGPAVAIPGSSNAQSVASPALLDSVWRLPPFLSLSGVASALAKPPRGPVGVRTVCGSSCVEQHHGSLPRSRAMTGAVIGGVAAVGIGAGLIVLLTQGSRSEVPSAIPDLQVKLSGQKGGATVSWRF